MKSSHTRRSRKASRDDARTPPDGSRAAGEASAQTLADVERLMGQMREANERLVVTAVQAQTETALSRVIQEGLTNVHRHTMTALL